MRTKTTPTAPAVDNDVFGMDAGQTLGFVIERRQAQDAEAAAEMRAVTHWADLHRTDSVIGAAIDPDVATTIPVIESTLGRQGELRLAGARCVLGRGVRGLRARHRPGAL